MNKSTFIYVFGILFFTLIGCEKTDFELEQNREEVIMRKIGHEILIQSNDTTSLILPIINEDNKYIIQFGADFGFQPEDLIVIVDSIFKLSGLNDSYLVEVEACKTSEVVYSYEVNISAPTSFLETIACRERKLPEGCYEVIIQFIRAEQNALNNLAYMFLIVPVFLIGLYYYLRNKPEINDGKIKIGTYLFDSKKMLLIRQEQIIELTSKENELLSLLYLFVNETVNKETILNKVWGDEGDYVGRTLDVYVSKLRKKLESDSSIQLKNIRGIGYKLIIEK